MVLLIGFKVVFGLEAICMRFVRLAVCLSFPLFTLSGYRRNAKVAMFWRRQPWVQQIMRNFLYTVTTAEPFFVSVILRTTISTGDVISLWPWRGDAIIDTDASLMPTYSSFLNSAGKPKMEETVELELLLWLWERWGSRWGHHWWGSTEEGGGRSSPSQHQRWGKGRCRLLWAGCCLSSRSVFFLLSMCQMVAEQTCGGGCSLASSQPVIWLWPVCQTMAG